MSEIKLNMRYPESRLEDVTDAYMRGFEVGLAMRTDENAELRELVRDMRGYVESVCFECRSWEHFGHHGKPSECGNDECDCKQVSDRMRELGIEVDG